MGVVDIQLRSMDDIKWRERNLRAVQWGFWLLKRTEDQVNPAFRAARKRQLDKAQFMLDFREAAKTQGAHA